MHLKSLIGAAALAVALAAPLSAVASAAVPQSVAQESGSGWFKCLLGVAGVVVGIDSLDPVLVVAAGNYAYNNC